MQVSVQRVEAVEAHVQQVTGNVLQVTGTFSTLSNSTSCKMLDCCIHCDDIGQLVGACGCSS